MKRRSASHQKTATRFALARVFLVFFSLLFSIVLFFDVDINVSRDCQVIRIARTSALFQRGVPASRHTLGMGYKFTTGRDGNEGGMATAATIKKRKREKRNCASSVINSAFGNDSALGNAESPTRGFTVVRAGEFIASHCSSHERTLRLVEHRDIFYRVIVRRSIVRYARSQNATHTFYRVKLQRFMSPRVRHILT